jgi:hypothetical protein
MSDPTGKNQRPPGTETCGCCDGVVASTPTGLFNRAGLSAISYRIGEYAQFKESLLAGLSSSNYHEPPGEIAIGTTYPLTGLRTRDSDDFTIALIDAVSCAADVLTFYQERLANESYLRTATERVSLQEMAKLIGYCLRPGVAAETWLAFALEAPKSPPPGLTRDPGTFVTGIPTSVTLEAGLKVQSVPGPDEQPQTFETVEAIDARPEWNAMQAVTSTDSVPGQGATEVWLSGVDSNLKPGDWLLFVGFELDADAGSDRWDARVLIDVAPDIDNNRTRLAWSRPLANVSPMTVPTQPPTLYALRQRASVFGHNAPSWNAMSAEFRSAYLELDSVSELATKDSGDWPDFDIHCNPSPVAGPIGVDIGGGVVVHKSSVYVRSGLPVSLDNSYSRIVAPSLALLVTPSLIELYKVTEVTETSRAQFAISGKSTCIGLSGDALGHFSGKVRELSVYVQSDRLRRGSAPKITPVSGALIDVVGNATGLPAGRRLLVKGLRHDNGQPVVYAVTLAAATAGPGGSTTVIAIDPPLPNPLRRDSVVVFGNVATATHGETVAQILGAGDASTRFQRFELKRTPLTYRSAGNEIGADSELSVRVDDIEWTEHPTLFGCGPSERAYTLTTDEQGKTWVVFGDGVRGARLRSGVNNVRTRYRQGLGRDGNVAADQLTQLITRPLGLKGVGNPVAAHGGADPEPADQARRTMPLGTRTLGRVVSLLDYEDFALAFTGIAKARAQVLNLRGGPTIAITVAGQDGVELSASNPVWSNLLRALKNGGDPHVRVVLLSYQPRTFDIGLKVKRDPAHELKPLLTAVETALRVHFAFDARAFGQPVLESEVIAVAHSVPGVVAVDLDYLYIPNIPTEPKTKTLKSRQTRLLASRMCVSGGVATAAELLTLDPAAPFDRLEEMI